MSTTIGPPLLLIIHCLQNLFLLFYLVTYGIVENLTWHNYEELTNELKTLEQKYPDLLSLYHLDGESVQGRKLWVMKITTDKKNQSRGASIKNVDSFGLRPTIPHTS